MQARVRRQRRRAGGGLTGGWDGAGRWAPAGGGELLRLDTHMAHSAVGAVVALGARARRRVLAVLAPVAARSTSVPKDRRHHAVVEAQDFRVGGMGGGGGSD